MKASEFKDLLIRSLDKDADPEVTARRVIDEGVIFDFTEGFRERVINNIYSSGSAVVREVEFVKNMSFIFYRIALTGVAAIVILLISIFLMEGTLSFNSFLGLGNNYDESILCLLTGN